MARNGKKLHHNIDLDTPEEAEKRRNDKENSLVDRMIGNIEARKKLNVAMAALRQEAKDAGLNSRVLETTAKRSIETDEQREERKLFESQVADLEARLGEFQNTPLGRAAVENGAGAAAH
jgi:hypothetical protein